VLEFPLSVSFHHGPYSFIHLPPTLYHVFLQYSGFQFRVGTWNLTKYLGIETFCYLKGRILTCDHLRIDVTWLEALFMPAQSSTLTRPVTPVVPILFLTPPRYAVALQAESATWLSTQ
jgi:hypothetical protein